MSKFDSGRAYKQSGISIEQRRSDSLNGIRFDSNRSDPSSANDFVLYRGGGALKVWDGSNATILGASGSAANIGLDDAYDDGNSITVDSSAVIFAGTHATNNVFELSSTGSTTGNVIDIQNNSSGSAGKDIEGTDDSWSVTVAGAALLTAITGCDALTAAASLTLEATSSGTITIGGTSTGDITVGGGGGKLIATTDFLIKFLLIDLLPVYHLFISVRLHRGSSSTYNPLVVQNSVCVRSSGLCVPVIGKEILTILVWTRHLEVWHLRKFQNCILILQVS